MAESDITADTTPIVEHAALSVEATSTPGTIPGWLSRNLRNLTLLVLLAAVIWIAIGMQNVEAQKTLVVAFVTLIASKSGASDALKVPGRDA